ncbi:MAG: PAS domain-containing protein [bacterium]
MPERKSKKRIKGFAFTNITIQPGDIVILLDGAGRIVNVNEEAIRTLGRSRSELVGLPWSTLFPYSGLDIRAVAAGRDFANGFDFVRPDGSTVSLYFFATPGLDEDNRPAGIVCIGRDVTPFWHATEKTLESEKKYQLLTRLCRDGVVVVSTTGKIIEVSSAAAEIAGLPVERLVGMPVELLVVPEERRALFLFGRKVIRKGEGETELRIVDRQGREKVLKIAAELFSTATERKIYAVVRDLTPEKELQATFARTELLLKRVFDAEPAALFLEKMDGTVLRANRAAGKLLQLPLSEIINRRLREIVPADLVAILPQMRTAILEQRQFQAEISVRRRDGRPLWLFLSNVLLETEPENLILTIVQDITEEKQALIELRENEARLKLLLNQIPALIWTTDSELICTSAIGSGLRGLSAQPGNLIGRKITAAFGDSPDIERSFQQALAGESVRFDFTEPGSGETEAVPAVRCYHVQVEPLRGLEGEVLGTVGLAQDVTEYYEIQNKLQEMLTHYQTLVEIAPLTIAVHQEGKIVMINRAGTAMLGYDHPAELIGKSVVEFVHPDDWPAAIKRIRNALEKGESAPPLKERLRRRDGTYILAEVRNAPLRWQDKPAVLVVAQDLSERERLSQQVQEILSHTRAILESAPQGIAAEYEGRIVYANTRFAKLFGYELIEVLGKPIVELLAPHERERIAGYLTARKAGKPAPNQYQFDGLLRNGTVCRFNTSVTTYRMNDRLYVLGFVTRAQDQ